MNRKEKLRINIQEKQEAMQRIVDTMDEEAQTLASLAAKADEVDSHVINIARLEESHAKVETELEALQDLEEAKDLEEEKDTT
ncbi:predicted protein [Sclerotinia sclerotiorum 1980 UF-70]|uniref:Uncharacterized protein n=2 Tax=Sclerotinia sclerotiorum (strain ATCC 18683 / 1980 / Ss-1) TaxID=665079 RepID=A7F7X9_SCLS1|nr:predicted protein [Sclerotinia sclerotiorum 1980 UF-70]APA14958.1 hypothetical protein sscle_14g097280 [Sclerotinia sclerotiorum 1980 UF-70]EDN98850.1 predicted protein [Sclerotinia sclerotiorum 1980 UF-70]